MPSSRPDRSRRRTRIALVLLLVAFINLPLVHSSWTRWRVENDGVLTTARVSGTEVLGAGDDRVYLVEFVYPEDVDPEQAGQGVRVDEAAYEEAVRSREIEVRHLAERPTAFTVEGEVTTDVGLVITVLGDVILLLVVFVIWRYGGRRRPWIRVVAIEDVERCPPGSTLERVEGLLYLVRGEVTAIEEGEVVLDLGDRDCRVVLDGHANPVGYQQPAQVRGRMVD